MIRVPRSHSSDLDAFTNLLLTARRRSDQPDFLELGFHDLLVERLHDVFVGAGVQGARDMRDVVFGGAEHHLGPVATRQLAQRTQKLVAVHLRHVPVEQDRIGQMAPAGVQRLLAVFGFHDLEFESFENSPRHLADDARVVNDQTGFHRTPSLFSFNGPINVLVRYPRHAATASAPISRTRSISTTMRSCPSRRWMPADTRASRTSKLIGLGSRAASSSLSTSPTLSIRSP